VREFDVGDAATFGKGAELRCEAEEFGERDFGAGDICFDLPEHLLQPMVNFVVIAPVNQRYFQNVLMNEINDPIIAGA